MSQLFSGTWKHSVPSAELPTVSEKTEPRKHEFPQLPLVVPSYLYPIHLHSDSLKPASFCFRLFIYLSYWFHPSVSGSSETCWLSGCIVLFAFFLPLLWAFTEQSPPPQLARGPSIFRKVNAMDAPLSRVSYFLWDLMPRLEQQWYYFNYAAKNEAPPVQWQQIGLFKSELNLIQKSRMSTQNWTETFVNSWSLQRWSTQWLWSFCLCRSWGSQKLFLCATMTVISLSVDRSSKSHRNAKIIFLTDVFLRIHSIHIFSKNYTEIHYPTEKLKWWKLCLLQ